MRTRALIPALALTTALVATVGASARPQATQIQIRTVLNAAQEVPSPTGAVSNARGTFSATVTKSDTGASVSWQMSFDGLTGNAIAAHIHTGAVGTPGPVVLALCGPCTSPASGTGALTQAALDALQAGTAYVNVHTPTNPAGEIRGQLATTAGISTALSSRQEVPRPKGNVKRATGSFTATLAKVGTTGTVAWRLDQEDLALFIRLSKIQKPARMIDTPIRVVTPAFMISELKRAFEIGFLLFVPFLVIDLVVASVLMSMGMMMLPPVVVSLPFKLIFFVLVDGWRLVAGSLVESFQRAGGG